MLYIYFLLYIVYLIIYRETVNRWAVCPHRLACLLVLVGDRFRRWAVYARRWACLLVLVGILTAPHGVEGCAKPYQGGVALRRESLSRDFLRGCIALNINYLFSPKGLSVQ